MYVGVKFRNKIHTVTQLGNDGSFAITIFTHDMVFSFVKLKHLLRKVILFWDLIHEIPMKLLMHNEQFQLAYKIANQIMHLLFY